MTPTRVALAPIALAPMTAPNGLVVSSRTRRNPNIENQAPTTISTKPTDTQRCSRMTLIPKPTVNTPRPVAAAIPSTAAEIPVDAAMSRRRWETRPGSVLHGRVIRWRLGWEWLRDLCPPTAWRADLVVFLVGVRMWLQA